MTGRILRLKDMIAHTGLSRTVIYERMNEKSPRYVKDFPKSFSLGGSAIGWFQTDVDEWLENCAANPKPGTKAPMSQLSPDQQTPKVLGSTKPPASPESAILSSKPSKKPQPTQTPVASQLQPKRSDRPVNLAQSIVHGGRINDRILHHLQMKAWTPATGAMIISGIEPPLDCNEIPEGGMGLDGVELHSSSSRFHQARSILRDRREWKDGSGDPVVDVAPYRFLEWCRDENIDSEWLRLVLELAGMSEIGAVDLTASRLALLTNR